MAADVGSEADERERPATAVLRPLDTGFATNAASAEDSTPQASPVAPGESTSTRSRASSIFSTGTRTSINTLPVQPPRTESHTGPIDVLLGRRNFRITARPGSILSISSFDHPAPPYSEAVGLNPSQSTATLTPASIQNAVSEEESPEIEQPTPRALRVQTTLLDVPDEASSSTQLSSGSQTRSPSPPSPPMSPLSSSTNAISAHYTGIVRTIDANHRAEIERLQEEHAIALAQTRNDIDAAYRIPFREARARADASEAEAAANKDLAEERAVEIESLKAQIKNLEKQHSEALATSGKELKALRDEVEALVQAAQRTKVENEAEVQRARNQIEDVWEGRWRDRMRLAAEQVKGAWEDGRSLGRHDGLLQASHELEAAWRRTETNPPPQVIQDAMSQWKAEVEQPKSPKRR